MLLTEDAEIFVQAARDSDVLRHAGAEEKFEDAE
jgi:hypothetical protein